MCPPVYQGDDIMFLIKSGAGGPEQLKKWLELYEFHVRDYSRLYKAHCAALQTRYRSSASASPVVSASASVASSRSTLASSFSESGSGSGASFVEMSHSSARIGKSGMRRFVRRMRSKGVTSTLPGGLCYTRVARPEARESLALALGAYPALGDVLSRPREEFLPLSATGSLYLTFRNGVAHVGYADSIVTDSSPGASVSVPFNGAMVSFAKTCEFEFGSYGHTLRGSSLGGGVDVGLSLDTPIGGEGVLGTPTSGPLLGASERYRVVIMELREGVWYEAFKALPAGTVCEAVGPSSIVVTMDQPSEVWRLDPSFFLRSNPVSVVSRPRSGTLLLDGNRVFVDDQFLALRSVCERFQVQCLPSCLPSSSQWLFVGKSEDLVKLQRDQVWAFNDFRGGAVLMDPSA